MFKIIGSLLGGKDGALKQVASVIDSIHTSEEEKLDKKILKNSINIDNKNFNFKNYQILSGEISLPEDHAIKVLYLDVKCNGKIYNYKHEFF